MCVLKCGAAAYGETRYRSEDEVIEGEIPEVTCENAMLPCHVTHGGKMEELTFTISTLVVE